MSGIRNYLKGERLRKSLEPTKCALCGGNHGKTELIMACGTCMEGWANYMGGNTETTARIRGGSDNSVENFTPKTEEPTAGGNKTQGSAARAGGGVGNLAAPSAEPRAVTFKEGPRSDKEEARPEEPATHTSTNATRARS